MKKVLIITYYWPPSGGAGVQRWVKFIKYFSKYNIKPFVITVDPKLASYPLTDSTFKNDIPEDTNVYLTKTFEPYTYYKKINKKEIPYAGFANESNPNFIQKTARFIRGNFFIPDARKGWNKFAYSKALEIIKKEKIDTVITTSPPHSTQLIGLKLKKELNVKWIADLRDPWTDIYYYKSMLHTKWAKLKDLRYEKKVLEYSDQIVVVSNSIQKLMAAKSEKIKPSKINIIPNGYDSDDFKIADAENDDSFTISYTGTITKEYPTESLFKALIDTNSKIYFTGQADELTKVNFNDTANFSNHVSHKDIIKVLLKSDLLILIIPEIKNNEGILTGKLFEYLGAKKPILCIGPTNGDAAKIIDDCKAGKSFDYSDLKGITEFIKKCKKNTFIVDNNSSNNYSREHLTMQLSNVIAKT
jgi:glycosyltransferase involved in cell wall biosynthesis